MIRKTPLMLTALLGVSLLAACGSTEAPAESEQNNQRANNTTGNTVNKTTGQTCASLCACEGPKTVAICDAEVTVCEKCRCAPGYIDTDDDKGNGCEASCTLSNGGTERCDGADNDCDGEVDNVAGVGDTCEVGVGACVVTGARACVDGESQPQCAATPGEPTEEVCDGIDNDCDGETDESFPEMGESCTVGVGVCAVEGVKLCTEQGTLGCDATPGAPPEAEETTCDGIDNDCDGEVDEGCDDDMDGFCDASMTVTPDALCAKGSGDCDDTNDRIFPGSPHHACDGKDNDCDGKTDELQPVNTVPITGMTPPSLGANKAMPNLVAGPTDAGGFCVGMATKETGMITLNPVRLAHVDASGQVKKFHDESFFNEENIALQRARQIGEHCFLLYTHDRDQPYNTALNLLRVGTRANNPDAALLTLDTVAAMSTQSPTADIVSYDNDRLVSAYFMEFEYKTIVLYSLPAGATSEAEIRPRRTLSESDKFNGSNYEELGLRAATLPRPGVIKDTMLYATRLRAASDMYYIRDNAEQSRSKQEAIDNTSDPVVLGDAGGGISGIPMFAAMERRVSQLTTVGNETYLIEQERLCTNSLACALPTGGVHVYRVSKLQLKGTPGAPFWTVNDSQAVFVPYDTSKTRFHTSTRLSAGPGGTLWFAAPGTGMLFDLTGAQFGTLTTPRPPSYNPELGDVDISSNGAWTPVSLGTQGDWMSVLRVKPTTGDMDIQKLTCF